MSIKDLTITDQNVQSTYVQSQPDRLTGTAQQNKAVFDAFPQLIRQRFNALLEALAGAGAAGEIPVGPIEGVTAENVQQALAAIQQNLTAYINKIKAATGASEVGVSAISGLEADNVQVALQALRTIQSAINQNMQTIMSEKGAAAVGVSTISGMQAQNVQKALEELRKAIDDSVSGIIPGGSITADMLADDVIKILESKADKTPPQEHEISFRSGWSNAAKSTYYKTQEGSCVVNCAVYGTGVASDNFIATLPAGFRPNATVCRAAHAYKGGIRGIAEAQIAANGDISIYSPIEFDYVSFGATFLAQN